MNKRPKKKKGNQPKAAPRTLPRWLALMLAVSVTLIGGVLYGSYSQRWGPPADLEAAGAHLAEMPRQIGRWTMAEELSVGNTEIEMLELAGYVHRRYVHQDSGQSIQVVVLVGPPGPIAVHTPEICFSSWAYELMGNREAIAIRSTANSPANTFWRVDFKTRNAFAEKLRTYYAWSPGGPWVASPAPRYEYAAASALYKIQLAASMAGGDRADPGRQFLEDFVKSGWLNQPDG